MGQAHHETTQVGVYGWKNLSLSQVNQTNVSSSSRMQLIYLAKLSSQHVS